MRWYARVIVVCIFVTAVMFSFLRDYVQIAQGSCEGDSFGIFCEFCGIRSDQRDSDCVATVDDADIMCEDGYYGARCTFTCRQSCPPTIDDDHCFESDDCSKVFLYLDQFRVHKTDGIFDDVIEIFTGSVPGRRRLLSVEPLPEANVSTPESSGPPLNEVTSRRAAASAEARRRLLSAPSPSITECATDCGEHPCTFIVRAGTGEVESGGGHRWLSPIEDTMTCFCGSASAPHRLYLNALDEIISSCGIEPEEYEIPPYKPAESPCPRLNAYVHADGVCRCKEGTYNVGDSEFMLCVPIRGHLVRLGTR